MKAKGKIILSSIALVLVVTLAIVAVFALTQTSTSSSFKVNFIGTRNVKATINAKSKLSNNDTIIETPTSVTFDGSSSDIATKTINFATEVTIPSTDVTADYIFEIYNKLTDDRSAELIVEPSVEENGLTNATITTYYQTNTANEYSQFTGTYMYATLAKDQAIRFKVSVKINDGVTTDVTIKDAKISFKLYTHHTAPEGYAGSALAVTTSNILPEITNVTIENNSLAGADKLAVFNNIKDAHATLVSSSRNEPLVTDIETIVASSNDYQTQLNKYIEYSRSSILWDTTNKGEYISIKNFEPVAQMFILGVADPNTGNASFDMDGQLKIKMEYNGFPLDATSKYVLLTLDSVTEEFKFIECTVDGNFLTAAVENLGHMFLARVKTENLVSITPSLYEDGAVGTAQDYDTTILKTKDGNNQQTTVEINNLTLPAYDGTTGTAPTLNLIFKVAALKDAMFLVRPELIEISTSASATLTSEFGYYNFFNPFKLVSFASGTWLEQGGGYNEAYIRLTIKCTDAHEAIQIDKVKVKFEVYYSQSSATDAGYQERKASAVSLPCYADFDYTTWPLNYSTTLPIPQYFTCTDTSVGIKKNIDVVDKAATTNTQNRLNVYNYMQQLKDCKFLNTYERIQWIEKAVAGTTATDTTRTTKQGTSFDLKNVVLASGYTFAYTKLADGAIGLGALNAMATFNFKFDSYMDMEITTFYVMVVSPDLMTVNFYDGTLYDPENGCFEFNCDTVGYVALLNVV